MAVSTRCRKRPKLARPNIVRLIIFRRPICPSTGLVDHRPSLRRQTARCDRLDVDPPAHAVALAVDEKPQIPALARMQAAVLSTPPCSGPRSAAHGKIAGYTLSRAPP